jgi:hypothetical protein
MKPLTVAPFAAKGMIAIPERQRSVGGEQDYCLHQSGVEFLAILPRPSGFFTLEIALELSRIFNRPHSDDLADSWRFRLS